MDSSLCNAEYEATDEVQCLRFIDIDLSAFNNENDARYEDIMYLPSTGSQQQGSIQNESFSADPIQFMMVDLRFMLDKFEKNDAYKAIVYQTLESLMTPQHILALTNNSILGLLWRLVCQQRKDERRDAILLTLSQTLAILDSNSAVKTDAAIVRAWVEESYNAKEEILTKIAEVTEQTPALVLTLENKMTRSQLLEITRSCNSDVLRTVMSLLNHLTIVTNQSNLPQTYLPLAMDDSDIFQLLPHLFANGLKFSLRPAAIMAMLCILSKNGILQERAIRFLKHIKGKWLDLELPENCAYAFSKLCVKLPQFFTDNENLFFNKLYTIGGLKINASTHISIEQAFIPNVQEIRHDTKVECKTCNILRSTTLFADVGTSCCVFCLPQNIDLKDTPESCTGHSSHLTQCSRCTCLYAVVQYQKLLSAPKCYYCRNDSREAPYRRCTQCQNKYVHYDSTEPIPNHGEEYTFLCAECQHSTTDKMTVDIQVSIGKLLDENKPQLFQYLNISVKEDINIFSTEWSLFKLKDKIELGYAEDINSSSSTTSTMPLIHKKKLILNSTAVFNQIQAWIQSGESQVVTCYICCNDVPRDKINTTCGNKVCHAEACTECLMQWYQAVRPGGIVLMTHLLCPFCKHAPNGRTLKKYNKQACTILRSDEKNDVDEHWYYGWCIDCYKVKKAQEKICIENGDIPLLTDFVCDECAEIRKNSKTMDIKHCPGINETTKEVCGVAINKKGGCNHITCTACHSDWCWLCVKTYGDHIYEHLTASHGNYGIEDEVDDNGN